MYATKAVLTNCDLPRLHALALKDAEYNVEAGMRDRAHGWTQVYSIHETIQKVHDACQLMSAIDRLIPRRQRSFAKQRSLTSLTSTTCSSRNPTP